jgi:serine/threonine protein phosphatase PrpC
MTIFSDYSAKGKRPTNEDYHISIINEKCKISECKKINIFGVFDGHGGNEVSKFISNNIAKFFAKAKYPLSEKYVITVFDFLQDLLKKNKLGARTGTTCVLAIQFENNGQQYLNVINTGDSRSILCRNGLALPLTKDHKPFWPEEQKRIKNLGGKIQFDGHDWRIKDLSVSRAFGDFDATPYVTHIPELYRYKIDKSDKFIVLACDGLWDVLTNEEVVNFILTNSQSKKIVAKKLVEYALKKGSTDNITVIVVFFS